MGACQQRNTSLTPRKDRERWAICSSGAHSCSFTTSCSVRRGLKGVPFCSLHADSFDRTIVHLNHRDVTMLCVSRAPLADLNDYKRRMGWSCQRISSLRNDFNYDFGVS